MNTGAMLVLAVSALSAFTFLSIVIYSTTRAQERSEFQRNETLRKVAEQTGEGAEKVLELIREEERIAQRKRHEGLKLGGLITTVVGIGIGIFFYNIAYDMVAVAAIPLLVGLSLLIYALFMAPKPE